MLISVVIGLMVVMVATPSRMHIMDGRNIDDVIALNRRDIDPLDAHREFRGKNAFVESDVVKGAGNFHDKRDVVKGAGNFHDKRDVIKGAGNFHDKREAPEEISKRSSILPYPPYPYPYPYPSQTYQMEMCCDGKKYNGLYSTNVDCCGEKVYSIAKARCCNNKTIPLDVDPNQAYQYQCCGDGLYNTATQACCDGNVLTRIGTQVCCGKQLYNNMENICCGSNIEKLDTKSLSCCGQKSYDVTTDRCNEKMEIIKIPSGIQIPQVCGDKIIDFKTSMCCRGTPQARQGNFTLCCGTGTYDSLTQVCCNGTMVQSAGIGNRCCNTKLYNPLKQVCCSGNLYDVPKGYGGSSYDGCQTSNYYDYNPHTALCCNGILMNDTNTQLCCNGNIQTRPTTDSWNYQCCGTELFNSAKKTCCNGKPVEGSYATCCGDQAIDEALQTCCNDEIYNIGEVPDSQCCLKSPLKGYCSASNGVVYY